MDGIRPQNRVILLGCLLLLTASCEKSEPPRPSVVLITLDTTRADRLQCYGHPAPTSPNLDRFAADGTLYTHAYSTSSWTLPAHASLFTGKFTSSHGARYDPNGPLILSAGIEGRESLDNYRANGLATHETTLADILSDAGYATGAVVAGPWMKQVFGLSQGFAHYDDDDIPTVSGRLAADVTDRALAWLEPRRDRPFFLFLNYYDPHGPYEPPPEFLEPIIRAMPTDRPPDPAEKIGALYDGEIRFMDHHLGRLLEQLRQWDLYDQSWIIITSDHGELLGEHGRLSHGKTLTQQEIRIPLLVKEPGADGGRTTDTPAQLTDVLPVLLRGLRLASPEGIQGAPPEQRMHPIVAEVYPLEHRSKWGSWRVLLQGDHKFSWNSKGEHQLVDLKADPLEQVNLMQQQPDLAKTMMTALLGYLASLPKSAGGGTEQTLDAETMEALKQLGYLR